MREVAPALHVGTHHQGRGPLLGLQEAGAEAAAPRVVLLLRLPAQVAVTVHQRPDPEVGQETVGGVHDQRAVAQAGHAQ